MPGQTAVTSRGRDQQQKQHADTPNRVTNPAVMPTAVAEPARTSLAGRRGLRPPSLAWPLPFGGGPRSNCQVEVGGGSRPPFVDVRSRYIERSARLADTQCIAAAQVAPGSVRWVVWMTTPIAGTSSQGKEMN